MTVTYITSTDEFKTSKSKFVVFDFTATWCGPCKFIGPIFDALSEEYADVKMDVDKAPNVAVLCGIHALPTFQFFKNGETVEHVVGASKDKLTAVLDKLVHGTPESEAELQIFIKSCMKNATGSMYLRANHSAYGLHVAAGNGHTEVIKVLLGANINLATEDGDGDTALAWATWCGGRRDTMNQLLSAGADASFANSLSREQFEAVDGDGASLDYLKLQLDRDASASASASASEGSEGSDDKLSSAGEDVADISTELKRTLTGLHGSETLSVTKAEYLSGKRPRFGTSNPEVMGIPFWQAMVRAGISAYQAKSQFGLEPTWHEEPAWSFDRFGVSFTELPDGRFLQIGGEHEDSYDPDFCIYNNVMVHDRSGKFQIMGYPKDVFPPTDFHSATHIDDFIYIVGGLGYHGSRKFGGVTPIYRLNCMAWKIEAIQSSGNNPGWIYAHKAILIDPGVLVVSGGKICHEVDGKEQHVENDDQF
jgi:thioredoxin